MDRKQMQIEVEPDDGGFIARAPELRLYGFGETSEGSIDALKAEIDALHHELFEDDDLTDDWIRIRELVKNESD